MKFTINTTSLHRIPSSCLVLGVYQNKVLPESTANIDKILKKQLSRIVADGDMAGKPGESILVHATAGVRAKRILLVGLGKQSELTRTRFASVITSTAQALNKYSLADALITLASLPVVDTTAEKIGQTLAQYTENSVYRYNQTKSSKGKKPTLKTVDLHLDDSSLEETVKKGLAVGSATAKGMAVARELGNLPANICTPTYLAEQAQGLSKRYKTLKTTVLGEAQMRKLGMGSLLSVGHGSDEESKLIVMEYNGTTEKSKPNVIVGKGITFDTGGISLKPGNAMDEMKFDMCGSASVLGTMTALCALKPKINVIGVIAAAENMPSGRATKPGDVVTSMSGKTIEVLNTDAEGRLVLCDALTYVERYKPKSVIDIATLTGACIVALGDVNTGLLSNNDELAEKLLQHGQEIGDTCWRLPMSEEYQRQLDSNFADIANIGGPKAGTITAACFLSRFTEKYPWAHLDIAGTAWLSGKAKGATGRPVPLLTEYLINN